MKRLVFGIALAMTGLAHSATETNLHVIDVMIAFDKSAVQWLVANGRDLPADFAYQKVQEMNLCLENSGLTGDFTFRLVGTYLADVDTSSLDLATILANIQSGAGAYKAVLNKRDELGADLFSFVTGGAIKNSQRGLGYTLVSPLLPEYAEYGMNVCAAEAVANDYTMVHEFAHNMGCGHADGLGDDRGYADYSRGAYISGNLGNWVTIMGYPDATHEWIPYFSSPNVIADGVATGSASCNNVRTLRETYQFVAKYRMSRSTPSPSPVVEGGFNPAKAATWQGVVSVDGEPTGVFQVKVGKATKSYSKVSVTMIGLDGKKVSGRAVKVPVGGTPTVPFELKDIGSLELTFGENGFIGTLGEATVRSVDATPVTTDGAATAALDAPSDFAGLLDKYLPKGEKVSRSEKKWVVAAKAGKLKYDTKAAKLVATGENIAGLKLTYAAKTQTFKGSFKVWTFDETKKKLKSVSANVTGVVVNGVGYGEVTYKKQKIGTLSVVAKEGD